MRAILCLAAALGLLAAHSQAASLVRLELSASAPLAPTPSRSIAPSASLASPSSSLAPLAGPALKPLLAAPAQSSPLPAAAGASLQTGVSSIQGAKSESGRQAALDQLFSGPQSAPPTDTEILSAWREAMPNSKAADQLGSRFIVPAAQVVAKHAFVSDEGRDFISFQVERTLSGRVSSYPAFKDELLAAHNARRDPKAREFMRLLGRWAGFRDHASNAAWSGPSGTGWLRRHLPPSPIADGEYWDLAAGPKAVYHIHHELEAGRDYVFVDNSPFVASLLRTVAELSGASRVRVLQKHLLYLEKPRQPIAVLRLKNVSTYVPAFADKLGQMADWVAPGGEILFQTDVTPEQRAHVEDYQAVIHRLLLQGWDLSWSFRGLRGPLKDFQLDSVVLKRALSPTSRTEEEALRLWKAYQTDGARADKIRRGRHIAP